MNARVFIASAALIVGAASGVFAQSAASPRFEVASIKLVAKPRPGVITGSIQILPGGRFSASEALPRFIIQNAYGLKSFQILGGPDWFESAHYDIDARAEAAANATPQQVSFMVQSLLEDRFRLKAHRETRDLPVYDLTVAKGGLKLREPKEKTCAPPNLNASQLPPPPAPGQPLTVPCGRISAAAGPAGAQITGKTIPMAEFARVLSNMIGRPVIDKTGFAGTFDVQVSFNFDQALAGLSGPGAPPLQTELTGPSVFTAVQEQLGLNLGSAQGPVEVLVIDRIEKPTEN
jgi:uncharacterized protein (TIGR03435 family)